MIATAQRKNKAVYFAQTSPERSVKLCALYKPRRSVPWGRVSETNVAGTFREAAAPCQSPSGKKVRPRHRAENFIPFACSKPLLT